MLELAAACAANGFEVELRGNFVEREVVSIEDAAQVSLLRPPDGRAASSTDTVLIPEGHSEALKFARVALSPVRAVVVLLAAPGLFGWSFDGPEKPPDPMGVSPADVGRPVQLEAARALGFELWSNVRAIGDQARSLGIPLHYIGVGRPRAYPEPPSKSTDVAFVEDNRWVELARKGIEGLRPGVSVAALPTMTHDDLLRELGRARVLVHLARIEGRSRVCEEARAMRTIPVMLSSNHMAEGTHASVGGVVVDDVSELAPAVHALLDDPARLDSLATAGYDDARRLGAWEPFVERVAVALAEPDDSVARFTGARAALGTALSAHEQELAALQRALRERIAQLEWELADGRSAQRALALALESAQERYEALRGRKAVRGALRVASVKDSFRDLRSR